MPDHDPLQVVKTRSLRRLRTAEQIMAEAAHAAFTEYLAITTAAVLGGDTSRITAADNDQPPNLDAWPPPTTWRDIVTRRLLPAFRRIWRNAWNYLHRQRHTTDDQQQQDSDDSPEVAPQPGVISDDDYVKAALTDFTERLTAATWPDQLYNAVRQQLVEAHANRESMQQLRQRIAAVLSIDEWSAQAATIARTEALAAYNAGHYAAAQARQHHYGDRLYKLWVATPDERVRLDHAIAHGSVAALDEPFTVGGHHLAYPHDPRGPASQTVSCRCVLNFVTADEAEQAREVYEQELPRRTAPDGTPLVDLAAAANENNANLDDQGQSRSDPGHHNGGAGPRSGIPQVPSPPTGRADIRATATEIAADDARPEHAHTPARQLAAQATDLSTHTDRAAVCGPRTITVTEEGDSMNDTTLPASVLDSATRMPGDLKRYWTKGEGAAKIRWGTEGDFDRCKRHLREYVDADQLEGLCANLHKAALGKWPGQHASAGGRCPCEDMSEEQVLQLLASIPTSDDEVSDDDPADDMWQVPADDDVSDDDLLVDGQMVSAADFTPSGSPTAQKRHRAEKNGAAMKGGRFPIENRNDLRKAISSLGRAKGGAKGRAAVKAHIIRRAKALGLTSMLPQDWDVTASVTAAADSGTWAATVAANVPPEPPADWFTDPQLTGPTKLRVTDEGRVYGHIAAWDTLHAVHDVPPPRDPHGGSYPKFHRHPVRTSEGTIVKTGPIATGTHGDTTVVDVAAVMAHYDDPNFVAADVVIGEDAHGIWASGALRPGVSPQQVRFLDTYDLSGHWLYDELIAACAVTTPAFMLPADDNVVALAASADPTSPRLDEPRQRASRDRDGRMVSLVAAGIVTRAAPEPRIDGWTLYREFKAAQQQAQRVHEARRRLTHPAVAAAAMRVLRR